MASISWKFPVSSIWTAAGNWSTGTIPGVGDDAIIGGAASYTVSLTTPISVNSITISDAVAGLSIANVAGNISVAAGVVNAGSLLIDIANGQGGSAMTIGGTLSNSNFLQIGPSNNTLSADSTVTAGGISNSGAINLFGSASKQATLNITATAAIGLTGNYSLSGDALLQFAGGAIAGIAYGGSLVLDDRNGGNARVAVQGSSSTNSALTTMSVNNGTLALREGASITTNAGVNFTNNGTLVLDDQSFQGGSSLALGGTLTNNGVLQIGPNNNTLGAATTVTAAGFVNAGTVSLFGGTSTQATLIVAGAPAIGLAGHYSLFGDALLQFASGSISGVAYGASLDLDNSGVGNARIALQGSTGTNSALAAMTVNNGTLMLRNGASITTNSGTNFSNNGSVLLDDQSFEGGSSLSLGGTLTNNGILQIGPNNNTLGAATTVTAAALSNAGSIALYGNASVQATLNVTSSAPVGLAGNYTLSGDTLLQFAGGGFTGIGYGASLVLDNRNGGAARVAIQGNTSSNSALTGLGVNNGTLQLRDGASITTNAGVNFTNNGVVTLDDQSFQGGSFLTLGGKLTNNNSLQIGPNNNTLGAATTVTATGLSNAGSIGIFGSTTKQATLNITAAAPGSLAGAYTLVGDALLQFAGGGINGIAYGASLDLDDRGGGTARIALQGAPGTNSALATMSVNNGTLLLRNGAAITTNSGTNLANNGTLLLDDQSFQGGSLLTLGGALTNAGFLQIGPNNSTLGAATTVTATGLTNSGILELFGSGGATAGLTVSGSASSSGTLQIGASSLVNVTNGGSFTQTGGLTTVFGALTASSVNVTGGKLDFTKAITAGTAIGGFAVTGLGILEFDAGVDAGHTVTFTGQIGTLALKTPASFAGVISGFNNGDAIDLVNTPAIGVTYSGNGVTGTLTINGQSGTLGTLSLNGSYTNASFATVSDGNGGTDIVLSAAGSPNTFDWTNANGGVWTNGSNWNQQNAAPVSAGQIAVIATPGNYLITLSSAINVSTIKIVDPGATVSIAAPGNTVAVNGIIQNGGSLRLDTSGNGGTVLNSTGTLVNAGTVTVGNGSITSATMFTAKALTNSGALTINGSFTPGGTTATLNIGSAAPTSWTGSARLLGASLLEFSAGQIGTINSGASIDLETGAGFIADAGSLTSNSALTGLSNNFGTLDLAFGAALSTTVGFSNKGAVHIDDFGGSPGGSSFQIGGALTNFSTINIGFNGLAQATTVAAGSLSNTGTINLTGNVGNITRATLNIAGTAGFGTDGQLTGTVNLFGAALLEFGSGQITTINPGGLLNIETGTGYVADNGLLTSNSALAGLANNFGTLDLAYGAAIATTGGFSNKGTVHIDDYGGSPGGSSLQIAGALTNFGNFFVGTGSLSQATTVTATGLTNSGRIDLQGSNNTATHATLNIAGTAGFGTAGQLTGTVNLFGASLLEFGSGQITAINLNSTLNLQTGTGFLADSNAPTSNSALTGLVNNFGTLDMAYGAAITTTGPFSNKGVVNIDNYGGSPGGSVFTIGGGLTNFNTFLVGTGSLSQATTVTATSLTNSGRIDLQGSNNTATHATLNIAGPAGFGTAGQLTGTVNLFGASLLEFASGQITAINTNSILNLQTGTGFLADSNAPTSNSALAGLINNFGTLDMAYGAAITTTGPFSNKGTVNIDNYGGSPGGSAFTIGGGLTNFVNFTVGYGGLTQATTITATSLTNSGSITLHGNDNGGTRATLNIAGPAGFGTPGQLTGSVTLFGAALLQFGSGQITAIANGATLNVQTGIGFVADSSAPNSNSALSGLGSNGGNFDLAYGASVTLTGGLDFTNTGIVNLDNYGGSPGGSIFHIGGALINLNTVSLGYGGITQATAITANGLNNTGAIFLHGKDTGGTLATLNIAGFAGFGLAGVLTGNVNLFGAALIEFGSGQITTIASGATLNLQTGIGFVADNGSLTSNSALTGLTGNGGTLDLAFGASITTTSGSAFANSGTVNIDNYGGSPGGSSLHIGGVLSNTGVFNVGAGGISQASTVSAAGLNNSGTFNLQGNGNTLATLSLSGSAANTGAVVINSGGKLDDTGQIYMQSAGTTTVSGTIAAQALNITGGVLQGSGTVTGNVVNTGGVVAGGANGNPGTLTISGKYSQTSGGTLTAILNGTGSGQFSTVAAATASISGGTLNAQINFALAAGESFRVVTFAPGTMPGLFSGIAANGPAGNATFLNLGNNLTLGVVYDFAAGEIDLKVATTPGSNADTWQGSTGTWTTAGNWTNGVPNFTSNVTIGQFNNGNVTLDENDTINSLTVNGGNALNFAASENLAVGGGMTIAFAGALTMVGSDQLAVGGASSVAGSLTVGSGDTLGVFGSLSVTGFLNLNGGTVTGPGALQIAAGGTLSGGGVLNLAVTNNGAIAGNGVLLDQFSLTNNGNITIGPTVASAAYLLNAPTGTISTTGTAVVGLAGSTIVNQGSIGGLGGSGAGIVLTGATGSTVVNSGRISGAGNGAISFGAGDDRLVLKPGATFLGFVDGDLGNNTLELAGATLSQLSGLGISITNFSQIVVDPASSWQLTDANTISSGVTVSGAGVLSNSGSLVNNGSIATSLTLTGTGALRNAAAGVISNAGTAVYGTASGVSITNLGAISSSSGTGVQLANAGALTNGAVNATTAAISGYHYGVALSGATGSITNFATISSANGVGVNLGGGAFSNGPSGVTTALVSGYIAGVSLYGSGGAVTNAATIKATGALGSGIYFGGSSNSVTNSGLIQGNGIAGAGIRGLGGSVSNTGTILGTSGIGIALSGGGTISNSGAGLIEGGPDGIYLGGGAWSVTNSSTITSLFGYGIDASNDTGNLTVSNSGLISGGSGVAVRLGTGSDLLIVGVGGSFSGLVIGGGGGTAQFAQTGNEDVSSFKAFSAFNLPNGAANTLTLADSNFLGVTGSTITVTAGSSGDKLSESGVSISNIAVFTGGVGADTLIAGQSAKMTGNGGADLFVFTTPGSSGTPEQNTIADFSEANSNKLVFSNSAFSLSQPGASSTPQPLPSNLFVSSSTGSFGNTTQRFAYDTANGDLFYSPNGSGGATPQLVVQLLNHSTTTLSAGDLFYIT